MAANGKIIAKYTLILLTFYVAGLVFLPRQLLLEVLNGTLATLCFMVCLVFSPSIIAFFRLNFEGAAVEITGILLMRFCIVGAWLWQMVQAIGRVYFIEFHPEVSGRTFDATYGLPAVGYLLFATGHIIAIGMVDADKNRVVRRNFFIVCCSIAIGLLGTLAIHFWHFWHTGL